MELENLLVILIAVCVLLVLEGAVILGVLISIKNKPEREISAVPQSAGNGSVHVSAAPTEQAHVSGRAKKDGQIICRSCYSAIPQGSRSCPFCGTAADRR